MMTNLSAVPSTPNRTIRLAQIVWLAFASITLVLYVAGVIVYYNQLGQICTAPLEQCGEFDFPTAAGAAQLAAIGMSLNTYALLRVGFRVVFALVPIGLGFLIFARKRAEPFALLIAFFLVTFGMAGEPLSVLGIALPAMGWFTTLIEYTGIVCLPLFFGLFPNGRMAPRTYWLVVIYFGVTYIGGSSLGLDIINDPVASFLSWSAWLSMLLGGVGAQIYRYARVSTVEEKRQTRWVLFGLAAMAMFLLTLVVSTMSGGNATIGTSEDADLLRRFVFLVLGNSMFEILYLSIGLAILRSRLFDIDIIIRRTLIYSIITATLALFYFGSVVVLQQILRPLIGAESDLAIIISTLVIAALFNPLRHRVQDTIDHRFYRRKYDAQQVLARFAQTARDEVELEKLTGELLNVVSETMQPTSVSLWLKPIDDHSARPKTAENHQRSAVSGRRSEGFDNA